MQHPVNTFRIRIHINTASCHVPAIKAATRYSVTAWYVALAFCLFLGIQYGFGFNQVDHDYKLVKLVIPGTTHLHGYSLIYDSKVQVNSFKYLKMQSAPPSLQILQYLQPGVVSIMNLHLQLCPARMQILNHSCPRVQCHYSKSSLFNCIG